MDEVIDRDRVLRRPFRISELEAAVRAALWREAGGDGASATHSISRRIADGIARGGRDADQGNGRRSAPRRPAASTPRS